MAGTQLSEDLLREALEAYERCNNSKRAAAKLLGVPRQTFDHWIREAQRRGIKTTGFEPVSLPDEHLPIEEILARRERQFEQKRRYEEASKLIPVRVTVRGPIGILHFGDPHLDDDGTDIGMIRRHVEIVKTTEGMFGANVGDTTNNWIGRLARLYGEQSTSAVEAWRLAEWFLGQFRWLYLIGGNHDCWSGAGDPIKWIARQTDSLYKSSEVRLALNFPNGAVVRVNARHDFSGTSIYNAAHGPMKALTWGVRDHIAICGHKHISGYGVVKDPDTGIAMHAIQLASYKIYDRYAKQKGMRDQTISPCAVTIIDPYLPPEHPDLVKVYWCPEEGAKALEDKRRRWKSKKG
jgi:transposase-like protein